MGGFRVVAAGLVAVLTGAGAATAWAHGRGLPATPSPLIAVSVEIDGETAPLYRAPDGSGRFYLEARQGRRYAVVLENRSAGRLGVALSVDGLNVISGTRDAGQGRLYVLDPWQRTAVRGWRASLQEVRAFTFVDERASYSARTGQANSKMGWIELAVYRERRPLELRRAEPDWIPEPEDAAAAEGEAGETRRLERRRAGRGDEAPAAAPDAGAGRAYPGTGWGRRTDDPAHLVDFEPESWAAERTTLRYEYRAALVALGVLPLRRPVRDRLSERDRAEGGFAQPPLW